MKNQLKDYRPHKLRFNPYLEKLYQSDKPVIIYKVEDGYNIYTDFSKKIIKNSNVNLYMVENNNQLSKYLKQNMYGKKIVVGMGAGSISNWIKELPSLM